MIKKMAHYAHKRSSDLGDEGDGSPYKVVQQASMSRGRESAFGNSWHDNKNHFHEFARDYDCSFVNRDSDED
jgi:hypothetical protein